ncbi:CBY1-interacting BAR domain-containing protein homolog isoform X1 [Malaya genurostris]|uniref:CBY1-interacting BAR domain-containing protein homolog isoform X1 n=1 Tax=Malaya genurostris TaxID=325434 RepID=UPI0026F3ED13|nr:CBY1-interacting BAR domain-containing protein homolog isoform X1 [Malaya genurostris]
MLRGANTGTILCEEQSKFVLERISTVEKHFSELCEAFAEFTRKVARLRDKSDELAHTTQDFSSVEKYNKSLSSGLSSLSKAITLLGDFQDLQVKRLENRIVSELSQYEVVCKHCKDSVKDAIISRDKELAKRKQLDQARTRIARGNRTSKDSELIKSNMEVSKSLKEIEEIVGKFEKQKLTDLKNLLMEFVMIELKFHTNAVEVLSATYQDISDIDEQKDYQGFYKEIKRQNRQFKKYLQQDELSDRYFLQRIKSQSMGALSSMFAASSTGNRKNKSLSSTSLNSSQEQETSPVTTVTHQDSSRMVTAKRKGSVAATGPNSVESMDSTKLSNDSKSTTENSDTDDDSDTATDSDEQAAKLSHQNLKEVGKNLEEPFNVMHKSQSPTTKYFIKSINGIVRNLKL